MEEDLTPRKINKIIPTLKGLNGTSELNSARTYLPAMGRMAPQIVRDTRGLRCAHCY